MRRFTELLRSCPLCVVLTDRIRICAVQWMAGRTALVQNYGWPGHNWELFGEASDLLFGDGDVWDWACEHPCAEVGIHHYTLDAQDASGAPVVDLFGELKVTD